MNRFPLRLDPAGVPFLVGSALPGAALLLGGVPWALAGLPLLVFAAFCVLFFRDPERRSSAAPDAVISPADGKVTDIRDDPAPDWPEGAAARVGIFLSLLDVHVARAPAPGYVLAVRHRPGEFRAAWDPEASLRNERAEIVVRGPAGDLAFRLIAGIAARRIVLRVAPGQALERGQRVGIIRFGSRAEVFLPRGYRPSVSVGDRVRAGETPVGEKAPA